MLTLASRTRDDSISSIMLATGRIPELSTYPCLTSVSSFGGRQFARGAVKVPADLVEFAVRARLDDRQLSDFGVSLEDAAVRKHFDRPFRVDVDHRLPGGIQDGQPLIAGDKLVLRPESQLAVAREKHFFAVGDAQKPLSLKGDVEAPLVCVRSPCEKSVATSAGVTPAGHTL